MNFAEEQKYKNEIGIYKILNKINNKVYVGQTREKFQRRYWLHQWELRKNCHDNRHLQNSWNKYGEDNFEFSVLEICSADEIDEKEKYWIKYFRKKKKCYNIQDGGQPETLNQYISPETRKRTGEKNRQRMLGTKLKEETKIKMSASRTGRRIHTKRDSLTDEQAIEVKKMLVLGFGSGEIKNKLNLPYKSINAILSNNAYSTLFVDGWEDFYKKHQKEVEERKQRGLNILEDLKKGAAVNDLAKKYNVDRNTINYYKKKLQ